MSRARVHEVSSPISLFPFIGILLCTMGALLVILVAVSRSAKNTAVREVRSRTHSNAAVASEGTHKKIEEVNTYVSSLNAVKVTATTRLTEEQLRLSQVEDHIRRLHERIQALQSAAVELKGLEQEHYDDHQQAQRVRRVRGNQTGHRQPQPFALPAAGRPRDEQMRVLRFREVGADQFAGEVDPDGDP
jgi:TolA-binding protein